MLQWMGVHGCQFTGVIHDNSGSVNGSSAHGASGGYDDKGGSAKDAMKLLRGACKMSVSTMDSSRSPPP